MSGTAEGLLVSALVSIAYTFGAVPAVTAIMSRGVTPDAPRQALEDTDSRLAASVEQAGPAQGFWGFLADDALFLEPGLDVIRGRHAIRSALAAGGEGGPSRMRLHRIASGRSDDAGLGYTFGWVEHRPDDTARGTPKYLATWRTLGGQWRLQAFATSPGGSPPSSPPDGSPLLAGYHGFVSPGDPRVLAAQVARADAAFARLASTGSTCAAFVALADRNAVLFGRTDFRWGIDAVRAAYSGCSVADRATWVPTDSMAAASGDLAWSVGDATFPAAAGSSTGATRDTVGQSFSYRKYLTVWARQPDGSWKWLLDAGNARPSPQRASRELAPSITAQ